jgi:antitoxin VapB
MTDTAKLFTHGRSQAVRLPKAFRFEGAEVRVSKVGNAVILQPMQAEKAMPWNVIDQTGDSPFMPDGRDQPSPPVDRVQFL